MERDPSLDALLELHGQVPVIDPEPNHWVRFIVRCIPASESKPHGLDYSLTLHGPDGDRLVGFDNAHQVRNQAGPGGRAGRPTIIDTASALLGRTTIRTPRHSWMISGAKLMWFCEREGL
jgi:hypothetical protein